MDFPIYFRCPISMEMMEDPVTISTGITYERKNIEKWFFTFKKKTCPATMQILDDFIITPNHTLKRLILSWRMDESCSPSSSSSSSPLLPMVKPEEMEALVNTIESSPFKVSSLKKLRSFIENGSEIIKLDFIKSSGVEIVVKIVVQILVIDNSGFATFEACEEALGILCQLQLSNENKIFELLSKPETLKSTAFVLEKGSIEARFYAVKILRNMAKTGCDWNLVIEDQGTDFLKSLLELVSDNTKATSKALVVLIEILGSSKKSRIRAIEAGAICVLIELLPEYSSSRSKLEKIIQIIKLLSECAEGRLALVEHGMGIAAVTKTMLNVSNIATKIGVKILWLLCTKFEPRETVLDEMMVCGSVKKMLSLLHMEGRSSTKEKVIKILKLHGTSWKRHPCFPPDFNDYLNTN